MNKKFLINSFVLIFILINLIIQNQALADDNICPPGQSMEKRGEIYQCVPTGGPLKLLEEAYPGVGPQSGVTGIDIAITVGRIIKIALSFLGIILTILIIYSGFLWMTAGGNEEQVTKAKKYLKNAIIGLIITAAAYGLTYFVIDQLIAAITPPGGGG